jgi:3-(3-hydroxy-phenyl)propionate hydroxylase
MTSEQRYEVVIVGFGPAGVIAACWLGQFGIKTLVVEKSQSIWEIPRALALDHEIMRVFQNIGVVERVLKHTAPFGVSEHFGAKGQLIRRIDVVPPPHPLGYLPNLVFTQPPVEAILRERAAEHASVSVSLGKEVLELSQEKDSVLVTIQDHRGKTETAKAAFVIACDGASSTVRRLMDVPFEDLGFDEPWLVVDLLVNRDALPKLPATCAQYCDPARPYTYIIGPGNHRRWEIMLNPGEDPRQVEREERVWQLLSRWLAPTDGKLWRASSYRFHALVAAKWRDRRVFLAGDAAHQQPPFIGQGMCQGVRDVTNLAWKLTSVLRGQAVEALLDTYEQERKQHVSTLTQRIKQIGAAICERDPEAARLRDESLLAQGGGNAPVVTRQEIVPPLQSGLLRPEFGPAAGTIFPQPRLSRSVGTTLLDEVSGLGWQLFIDGRSAGELSPPELPGIRTFVIGGEEHPEAEGVAATWFDRYQCKAAIVRPDHCVYCGISEPHQAAEVWREYQPASGAETIDPLPS